MLIASFCVRPLGGWRNSIPLCVQTRTAPIHKREQIPLCASKGNCLEENYNISLLFPLQYSKQINGVILWWLQLRRVLCGGNFSTLRINVIISCTGQNMVLFIIHHIDYNSSNKIINNYDYVIINTVSVKISADRRRFSSF